MTAPFSGSAELDVLQLNRKQGIYVGNWYIVTTSFTVYVVIVIGFSILFYFIIISNVC